MKYISLNWTFALKFSIGKKKRMRDCRILMVHESYVIKLNNLTVVTCHILILSYQLRLKKMRAELANLNHYAVPFSNRAAVNLSWYDSTIVPTQVDGGAA